MSAAFDSAGKNDQYVGSTTNLVAPSNDWGGRAIPAGAGIIIGGCWANGAASLIDWLDDVIGSYTGVIASFKHPVDDFYIGAAYAYNQSASAERIGQMELNAIRDKRSIITAVYTGLRTSPTPFVVSATGSANSGSSVVTAANVDPGGAGLVLAFAAALDYETFTSGSFTVRKSAGQLALLESVRGGAGNVAMSATGSGTNSKLIMSLAFRDTSAGTSAIVGSGGGQMLGV